MTGTIIANKNKRDPYIDVLKGFAMLGVILAHYYLAPNTLLVKIATIGSRCPQFFFIASAFLTWKVLDKQKGEVDYKGFYSKRFFRIGPIYWLALLVSLLLPVVTISQHSIGDLLTHVVFLNGLVPQWSNNIMHVEWYIADLVLLYFLCPLLRRFAYNLKLSIALLVITILLSSISLIVSNNVFASQIAEYPSWEMYFHTFFFLNQLPVWMLGVVVYYLLKEIKYISWRGILLLISILVVVNILFEQFGFNKRFLSSSFVAGLGFTLLFLICFKLKQVFHHRFFKPLEWIGKHSFGIYCFHFVTIRTLAFYGVIETSSLKGWSIGLIISLFASLLVGFTVEICWNAIQNKSFKRT